MAIRMTGLASGLDTESIIKELMSAKSMKKTKIEQSKQKLEWKKEKWADLNTKLYKLYQEQASKLRMQSTYQTKKASSSDETLATVTAAPTATNGTYTMEISQIATSQYITSAQLATVGDGTTAATKLKDLDPNLINKEIQVTTKDGIKAVRIRENTTIADFTSMLNDAGLNASFDAKLGRLFVSSKDSGSDAAFSMGTVSLTDEEIAARTEIENLTSYSKLNSSNQGIISNAFSSLAQASTADEIAKARTESIKKITDVYTTQEKTAAKDGATAIVKARLYNANYAEQESMIKDKMYEKDSDGNYTTLKESFVQSFGKAYDNLTPEKRAESGAHSKEEYIQQQAEKRLADATKSATESKVNSLISDDSAARASINALTLSGMTDEQLAAEGFTEEQKEQYKITSFLGTARFEDATYNSQLQSAVTAMVDNYLSVDTRSNGTDGTALSALGLGDVSVDSNGNVSVAGGDNVASNPGMPRGMAVIGAKNSKVTLNGAELETASANITVNGLTINLKNVTSGTQKINFTVSNDIDGVYKNVKDFVSAYNDIVKEMNTLYYAESAKGYEPLSDDEKKAMSDDAIEKWETKIKGALFKNDSTVEGILSGMRTALASPVEIDGKNYSLANFGVTTSTNYAEGGLLHIYGDSDDGTYASYTDKLKAALQEDPDKVMEVFSQVGQKLYKTLSDKMASSKVSSALTFYNDKQIKKQLEDYSDQIDDWTDRLEDIEDSYYKQFSAMETQMAKLNSQTNSLSSLFGS